MAITYSWIISSLDCAKQEGTLQDVVVDINWRRQASEVVDDKTYTTDVYGQQALGSPDPNNFIPYPDLTQAEVEGWLVSAMGQEKVDQIDASLAIQLQNLIAHPIVQPPLPWS